MKKVIKILRRKSAEEKPYYELFSFETQDKGASVGTALMQISQNTDLTWEHSCLQKKCGACAMIIDGKPALACDTRLSDCRGETVVVEPLRKFPVVRDLLVDRSAMTEKLKEMRVYPVRKGDGSVKEELFSKELSSENLSSKQIRQMERDDETLFAASRCIQCGLCLEVCPNYYREGVFSGMAGMSPMAGLMAKEDSSDSKAVYRKYVYEGCGKSLACRDVCPAGIDMDQLLSESNRRALYILKSPAVICQALNEQ